MSLPVRQAVGSQQLLRCLPVRRPCFAPNDAPRGIDGVELAKLRGLGPSGEVWLAADPDDPRGEPIALKFAVEPGLRKSIAGNADLFRQAFALNEVAGVVPLRAVYTESDPPCIVSPFVRGYDLTAVMYDWRWRSDGPKPDAALRLVRRLAEIVGSAHARAIVHRDLKPSNVLVCPTEAGRFTLWVTDFGWGQIEAARVLELCRHDTVPRGDHLLQTLRGAHTPLYASPQQSRKEEPDPRDDVYALGMVWYQLLKRDPQAAAPVGGDWAEEFAGSGLTDTHARVLSSCLATRPDKRPADANELFKTLANVSASISSAPRSGWVTAAGPMSGTSLGMPSLSLRGKAVDADATTKAAAAVLKGEVGVVAEMKTGHLPRLFKNTLGMVFTLVPDGAFEMGSPEGELGRREDEGPRHHVRVTKPFYMGVTPVTQAQFEKVMHRNPSKFTKGHGGGPDHPVEAVSWEDAYKFCKRLARLPEEEVHGRTYRLPSEAEWEYACRAGTDTAFAFGDTLTPKFARFAGKGGAEGTSPVATHAANNFNLTDMHGNVQEWCDDWYDEYYYFDSPNADPHGPKTGLMKVVRGGSHATSAQECRSAARRAAPRDQPVPGVGFRVVMAAGK